MEMLERRDWVRALTALPRERIFSLSDECTSKMTIRHMNKPTAGLGMLKMRDGAKDESFLLGEFPLATSHLLVIQKDGCQSEGGAVVMDDDDEYATALAILDAIMAGDLELAHKVEELIVEGSLTRKEEQRIRKSMLARTKVDFSNLVNFTGNGEND